MIFITSFTTFCVVLKFQNKRGQKGCPKLFGNHVKQYLELEHDETLLPKIRVCVNPYFNILVNVSIYLSRGGVRLVFTAVAHCVEYLETYILNGQYVLH